MDALLVKQDYVCRSLAYRAGETIYVTPEQARMLLADSPESFERVAEGPQKAPDAPEMDKAIHKAPRKK